MVTGSRSTTAQAARRPPTSSSVEVWSQAEAHMAASMQAQDSALCAGSTAASRGHDATLRAHGQSGHQEAVDNFKLSKFEHTQPRVDTHKGDEEV